MNDYDLETDEYLSHGMNLFIAHMMGDDERSHIEEYVKIFQPHGTIVDMGCGIGETGELIKEFVPSSRTINVTNSSAQADYMVKHGRYFIQLDYHDTGLANDIADCVMFNESFGYGNPEALMAESARILKEGGFLLMKEFTPISGLSEGIEISGWEYFVYPLSRIIGAAEKANLKLVWAFNKDASVDRFLNFFLNSKMKELHGNIDFPCNCICMKFVKMPVVTEGKMQ